MPPVGNNPFDLLKQAFPLPVVATLVVYTMGASSFISSWKSDIEARLLAQEKVTTALSSHESRLVILEQQFLRFREDLIEIKAILREHRRTGALPMEQLDGEAPNR